MATANFKTPDFTYDPTKHLLAGRRPYREETYRLEPDHLGNKLLVHNYGHGGGGITMALGCAHEVRDIVRNSGSAPAGTSVAVLGGGIMGLTAAKLLNEMQLNVTIYAKSFTKTVSHVAGGQWSPSMVNFKQTTAGKQEFARILTRSYRGYEDLMTDPRYGISRRPNYTSMETAGFQKVPPGLVTQFSEPSLPFEGHNSMSGFRYETLLVEPPLFLGHLASVLRSKNVSMQTKTFLSPDNVKDLPEPIVINCTGLGSKEIWPDGKLKPKRGQLILLPPQSDLPYLYSGMPNRTYIFPRQDGVVVGGSVDDQDNDNTDPVICAQIIASCKEAFSGRLAMMRSAPQLPSWAIPFSDE